MANICVMLLFGWFRLQVHFKLVVFSVGSHMDLHHSAPYQVWITSAKSVDLKLESSIHGSFRFRITFARSNCRFGVRIFYSREFLLYKTTFPSIFIKTYISRVLLVYKVIRRDLSIYCVLSIFRISMPHIYNVCAFALCIAI